MKPPSLPIPSPPSLPILPLPPDDWTLHTRSILIQIRDVFLALNEDLRYTFVRDRWAGLRFANKMQRDKRMHTISDPPSSFA